MREETKQCQNCEGAFTIDASDFALYDALELPAPTQCPLCRWQYLLSFWVFGKFRKTQSSLSGKSIITTLSPKVKFPIYTREEWISDRWDSLAYGQDYDPSRSFLEQLAGLQARVPHPHQTGTNNVRCEWSDDVWESKDCYLSKSILDCEYVHYGYRLFRCKNSLDLTYCFDTEQSYNCTHCFRCYKVYHSFDARDSIDSAFLYDCRKVQNCFMCWNLRNKQYHILNEPYSREEYFAKLREFDTRSFSGLGKLKEEFRSLTTREAVHRENFNTNAIRSSGNFLTDCRNCYSCHFLDQSENCRYNFRGLHNKESIDAVGSSYLEKSVLTVATDLGLYQTAIVMHSTKCRYSMYLEYCENCEYCFGCVGLRQKNFCILNKQYSESEYRALMTRIKEDMVRRGEWGGFFPPSMAYCGYNFSNANIFFPETRESIKKRDWWWEEEPESQQGEIKAEELPDSIGEVENAITARAITCPKTDRRFNIAPHELAFLREHGIPLPRYHFDWRTIERLQPLIGLIPQRSYCFFCKKPVFHYYPPELGYQKIACMECYQKEIG